MALRPLNEPLSNHAAILKDLIKETGYLDELRAELQDSGGGPRTGNEY